jgi:hypothetical protein
MTTLIAASRDARPAGERFREPMHSTVRCKKTLGTDTMRGLAHT